MMYDTKAIQKKLEHGKENYTKRECRESTHNVVQQRKAKSKIKKNNTTSGHKARKMYVCM